MKFAKLLSPLKLALISSLTTLLMACAVAHDKDIPPTYNPLIMSNLAQGKRLFTAGYYKKSMHLLLPLACDGIPEAQYGVGYMYYYGYGVAQDPEVGYFWIERAAQKGYKRAIEAIPLMHQDPTIQYKKKNNPKATQHFVRPQD